MDKPKVHKTKPALNLHTTNGKRALEAPNGIIKQKKKTVDREPLPKSLFYDRTDIVQSGADAGKVPIRINAGDVGMTRKDRI